MRYLEEDWKRIGHNVHVARIIRGLSQEDFAHFTGLSVTTIYRIEKGKSISNRSLQSIARSIGHPLDSLTRRHKAVLTPETGPMVHRWANTRWAVAEERRTRIADEDYSRIQDPTERVRLGRIGHVDLFVTSMDFIMPNGPGPNFFEVYSRVETSINPDVYREALIFCVSGPLLLGIRGQTIRLETGDIVGYMNEELEWLAPGDGATIPAKLTWVGAVRIGLSADAVYEGQRAKRNRKL